MLNFSVENFLVAKNDKLIAASSSKEIELPGNLNSGIPNARFVLPEPDAILSAQFAYQHGNAFFIIIRQKSAILVARFIQRHKMRELLL